MNAQPGPRVSGRYFLPNAPLLCTKRTPAACVMSAKWIPGWRFCEAADDGSLLLPVVPCVLAIKNSKVGNKQNAANLLLRRGLADIVLCMTKNAWKVAQLRHTAAKNLQSDVSLKAGNP